MVSAKILPYMETNEMRAPPPPEHEASEDGARKHVSKVSPYASPSCKVYFKSGRLFRVPRDLLCEALESIRRSSNEIRLKNVPDEAGHVLIHYFHTGKWQILESEDILDAATDLNDLEVSLHVYATAQTYNIPGLAELAKQEILSNAGSFSDLQVLVSASDACQLVGENNLWFSAFIKRRVERLFQDTASLNKARFLMCFDTATPYSQMLVGLMLEICCKNSSPFYPESQATPLSEREVTKKPLKDKKKKKTKNIAEPEPVEEDKDAPVHDPWAWGVSKKIISEY
ncbi:hypothetical protein LZ30DRAFT_664863 [Colletotrichum cereale]|nr:hypothetical protein LZ30DRAFT_664863 [Colletotrichum cereale]